MLLATLFGWKGILYIFGHGGVRLGLWRWPASRFAVAGREHLPLDRAAVYCANHQSNVDPPVLFTRSTRACTSSTRRRSNAIPVLARAFRHRRVHPDRPPQQGSGDAIDRGRRRVDPGRQLVPDLSRKARAAGPARCCRSRRAASSWRIKAQAPIVPVAIQGGRAAMRRGSRIIRPVDGQHPRRRADRDRRRATQRPRRADRDASASGLTRCWRRDRCVDVTPPARKVRISSHVKGLGLRES